MTKQVSLDNLLEENKTLKKQVKELEKYKKLLAEGKLLKLPCRIGTIIYEVVPKCKANYTSCLYQGGYGLDRCGKEPCGAFIRPVLFKLSMLGYMNKSFFLTETKAKEALEKLQSKRRF